VTNPDMSNPKRRPENKPGEYDTFRESLAAPVPNRSYRSQIDMIDTGPSVLEQLIRYVAIILDILIAIRFVIKLFAPSSASTFVTFIYGMTNWIILPFQPLVGAPPATLTGYFDWASLAAIAAVSLVAALLIALIKPRPVDIV
jgi:hypothetical protein